MGGKAELRHDYIDELVSDLRVALPGVQVLFAFLLTVPFTNRFARTDDFQRDVYAVALLAAATASILLIAPAVIHRLLLDEDDKMWVTRIGTRFAIAGTSCLAVAIAASTLLVVDVTFDRTAGWIAALWIVLLVAGLVCVPVLRRRR